MDSLIGVVKAEVARRGTLSPAEPGPTTGGKPKMESGPRKLEDFLNFHDEAFVRVAYRYILNREPDGPGLSHFLELLRTRKLAKIDVLGSLRFSAEGKKYGI